MNRCTIFGHKSWRDFAPTRLPHEDKYVLVGCDRCNMVFGAWVFFKNHWAYFKR